MSEQDETVEVAVEVATDDTVEAALSAVHDAAAVKTAAIASYEPKCMVCTHKDHDAIIRDKYQNRTNTYIAKTYFPEKVEKTVLNSLTKHFDKHVNIEQAVALQSGAPLALSGQGGALPVSAQLVFDEQMKERINASIVLERLLATAMERFNVIEEEFRNTRLMTKCDACGRGKDDSANLSKILSIMDRIRTTAVDWVKIKNPREVHKYFFKSTYMKFCDIMTGHYVQALQEKGRLIRQAVTEFSQGQITHQLLLRRVAEVEDLGATAVAEKAILEMRKVLEFIDREFGKANWGDAPSETE